MPRQRTFLLGEYSSVAAFELQGPARPVSILIGCQSGSSGRLSAFPCRVKRRADDPRPRTGPPPIVTPGIPRLGERGPPGGGGGAQGPKAPGGPPSPAGRARP